MNSKYPFHRVKHLTNTQKEDWPKYEHLKKISFDQDFSKR